jgi:hypothetical protein
MLNLTTKRTVLQVVQKTFFGILIGFLLAPLMLSFGQQTAGGLRRFYSKESKVGFRYPAGWKFQPGVGSVAGDNFSRLATVSMPEKAYHRTNFREANATLSVGSISETACKEFWPDWQADKPKPRKVKLGNLVFYTVSGEEGAAGSFYNSRAYRTFYDGKCFEASLELQAGLIAAYDPGTVKAVNDKMIFNLLETVVRTLYFGK